MLNQLEVTRFYGKNQVCTIKTTVRDLSSLGSRGSSMSLTCISQSNGYPISFSITMFVLKCVKLHGQNLNIFDNSTYAIHVFRILFDGVLITNITFKLYDTCLYPYTIHVFRTCSDDVNHNYLFQILYDTCLYHQLL